MRRVLSMGCLLVVVATLSVACSQSDASITAEVKAKMLVDDLVTASTVDVETANRVVTLSGSVPSAQARSRAVGLARNTDGVQSVIDNLVVSSSPAATAGIGERVFDGLGRTAQQVQDAAKTAAHKAGEQVDGAEQRAKDTLDEAEAAAEKTREALADTAMTAAVKGKLLADADVSGLKIEVETKGAVVTLGGVVRSMAERDRAVAIARETSGVRSVVDRMRVER
jgi:hyperosmotically inducible protein